MKMESPGPSSIELQLKEVKAALLKLPRQHQLAFAAWCCERLYPIYAVLAKIRDRDEGRILRGLIDRLWQHVFGKQLSSEEIGTLLSKCDELEFDFDADVRPDDIRNLFSTIGHAELEETTVDQMQRSAMDAVGAVWSSLQACKQDTAENATMAAKCLLDRTHGVLWDRLSPTSGSLQPETVGCIHKHISEHPLMLDLCRRIHEQLSYLQATKRLSRDDPKLP